MRIASMISAMITAAVLGVHASGASIEMQILSDQSIRAGEPEVVVNPRTSSCANPPGSYCEPATHYS